ncbi:MAG: sugar phosphate isomerase/epimerase [Oscillospiraceae bacterium]|nr:sugar phosphate isomerase/epimerase [Oscillospiraceae bacterium]
MKLSFSTVGCPDWDFDEIFVTAKDLGYSAIEIRGLRSEIYAPHLKIFSEARIEGTLQRLKNADLKISMLASNAVIGFPQIAESGKKEAFEYIDLAQKINAPFVRVLISPRPEPDDIVIDTAAAVYLEICEYAEQKNVVPLIETNGIFAESSVLRGFMEKIQSQNKGVVWDINHPCRFFGESAELTFGNIGGLVKYMHIKDSVGEPGKIIYKMTGHGDLPVKTILELMKRTGYDGYLSLEWTKRWLPNLEEPGIVFSHYANYMQTLLGN